MSSPYVGEIRMFAGSFPPNGWEFCEGQTLPISLNDVLFSLIGTTYGGDGVETFNLPDLRGRMPVHQGTNSTSGITTVVGEMGGVEEVTLGTQQMPSHGHTPHASSQLATTGNPANAVWAAWTDTPYAPAGSTITPMNTAAVSTVGGGQPHSNMPPYLAVSFIISLFGNFPSQN
ncbi:phage tail protein [Cryobacterium glaciale]|uniref:Phage tail protein n=1 Tax=Cryobacterium glaciale TaxID=1259145 RepID=A0A4R8V2W9_9MICO|nr:tail fiber protein [Cryobacterium glaciale]TFB75341.1 phage tail protein [Cryobacterium glaciale]